MAVTENNMGTVFVCVAQQDCTEIRVKRVPGRDKYNPFVSWFVLNVLYFIFLPVGMQIDKNVTSVFI